MKPLWLIFLVLFSLSALAASEKEFGGLENAMDPETYEKAGLSKLSQDERAVLDQFIRDYVTGKQKAAASQAAEAAVSKAIQEHKVETPQVVETRMVGTYKGMGPRTVWRLENGQVWAPTGGETMMAPPLQNPRVIIFHDFFGWKMFIEGGSTIRVKPVLK